MAKIPFITELNNIPIYASRAECTQTGQNIDDALDGIVANVSPLVAGNNVTLTQNSYGTVISAYGSTGPCGPRGATGLTGATGPTGLCGPLGFCGPSGATGLRGFCGPSGVCGPSGNVGLRGTNCTLHEEDIMKSLTDFIPTSTEKTVDTWNNWYGIAQYQFHTESSTSFIISSLLYESGNRIYGVYYQISETRDAFMQVYVKQGTSYEIKTALVSGTASRVYARINWIGFQY